MGKFNEKGLQISRQGKEILSQRGVAKFFEISESALIGWRKRGIIKAHKIGGRVYFRTDEVKALFNPLNKQNNA